MIDVLKLIEGLQLEENMFDSVK